MLLLLLLTVFISFLPKFSIMGLREFSKDVNILEKTVENCSKNCSSVHMLNGICRCLDLSKYKENCTSRSYAIDALKSLHPTIPKWSVRNLKKKLEKWNQTSMKFCSLPLILSPKTLVEELKLLVERESSRE